MAAPRANPGRVRAAQVAAPARATRRGWAAGRRLAQGSARAESRTVCATPLSWRTSTPGSPNAAQFSPAPRRCGRSRSAPGRQPNAPRGSGSMREPRRPVAFPNARGDLRSVASRGFPAAAARRAAARPARRRERADPSLQAPRAAAAALWTRSASAAGPATGRRRAATRARAAARGAPRQRPHRGRSACREAPARKPLSPRRRSPLQRPQPRAARGRRRGPGCGAERCR